MTFTPAAFAVRTACTPAAVEIWPMCSRRARAGANVLLVLLAGLAEVDVHIEQAWQHDLAGQVDALGVGPLGLVDDAVRLPLRASSPNSHHAAVTDVDVGHGVETHLRVDDAGTLKNLRR
ncbi:hypothetical protein V3M87_08605 [Trueperella pyogenes]|uniref:hypothetical protein n=1 Tax=Trueperella pyogenes TaxID=1661 RepID=UPI00345D337E